MTKKNYRVDEDTQYEYPLEKWAKAPKSKNEKGFKSKISKALNQRKGIVAAKSDIYGYKAAKIGRDYASEGKLMGRREMMRTIMKNDQPDVVVKVRKFSVEKRKRGSSAWNQHVKQTFAKYAEDTGLKVSSKDEFASLIQMAKETYTRPSKSKRRRSK